MEIPDGGERPKSPWDWVYKLSTILCFVLIYLGMLWARATFVLKDDHDKERVEDRIEYEKEQAAAQKNQETIINQQNALLIEVNGISTKMLDNVRRDNEIMEQRKQLDDLKTYVYTHSGK